MQLVPEGGVELIRDFDLNSNITEEIQAVGHDTFLEWEWSITPELEESMIPSELKVIESGDKLIVGWNDPIINLFPIVFIKYLHNKEVKIVKSWNEVPETAQVIKLAVHPLNKRNYYLKVVAKGLQLSSGNPTQVEVEGEYLITILHQHDSNKLSLLNIVKTSTPQFNS